MSMKIYTVMMNEILSGKQTLENNMWDDIADAKIQKNKPSAQHPNGDAHKITPMTGGIKNL